MEHYKSNEELKITRKHLEMAKQRDIENVSDFITRWRELVSQMVDWIPEEEQLSMIAKNFKLEIRASMGRQYFEQYKALMHVANETEKELAKTAKLKKASSQYK